MGKTHVEGNIKPKWKSFEVAYFYACLFVGFVTPIIRNQIDLVII